ERLLVKYDAIGLKNKYHMIFAYTDSFFSLWKKYKTALQEKSDIGSFELIGLKEEETEQKYIKICKATYREENENTEIFHIFLNMSKPDIPQILKVIHEK
nr:hypothetical protein [Anaerolineaceae bacterium]